MNDPAMTNVWLAILAVVSLVEFFMIIVAGLFAYRLYKQAMTVIETLERVHIAPLRARVDALLDDVETITGKVEHAQETVGAAFQYAASAGSLIASTVKVRAWPILGILKGVQVALNTLFKDKKNHRMFSER
jgi:hypothetical protein